MNETLHTEAVGSRAVLMVLALVSALLLVLALPAQDLTRTQQQGMALARSASNDSPEPRLLLGFADRSGLYLANVQVAISDDKGNAIAETVVDGPWLNLELDPGTYHISASFEGKKQELRNLYLSERGTTTRVLYWDLKVLPSQIIAAAQTDPTV